MEKNKYDFIIDLLSQNRITILQKEQILKLSMKEIKNLPDNDETIIKRLEIIESKLKENLPQFPKINSNFTRPELPKTDLPQYLNPTILSKFLSDYNQHPVLKYTCHTIDDSEIIDSINKECGRAVYNFMDHQILIEKSFHELANKYYGNLKIKSLILVYLTGKSKDGKSDLWSSEQISINWKSPELIKWADLNPGQVPNPGGKTKNKGFRLPNTIKSILKNKRINYFQDLVIHYKNLFHLKDDNSLIDIILNVNRYNHWNDKIDFIINEDCFQKNLELFTDVDKLIQAYKKIVNMIIDVSELKKIGKPIIALNFLEIVGEVNFTIHHKNSVYQKSILSTINRLGETQTLLIKNQINGLCDLYLKADFGSEEYAEINLWDGKNRESKKLNYFEGVEFILKFRK
jgi:hypothetical protein